MARKRLNPAIKRSRTRSGCLTCRDRHMKCDEQQPVCKNCLKSKRKCYRGIRLNFTQYTIYNPEESSSTLGNRGSAGNEESEGLPGPRNVPYELKLLDQSITIASLYKSGKQLYEPYLHLHRPEDLTESDKQYQRDVFASFPSNSAIASYETETDSGMPPSAASPSNPIIKPDSNIETEKFTENYDITNLLLHNSYYINQNSALYNQTPPHSNAPTTTSASITSQPDPSSSSNIQNLEHVIKDKDSILRHIQPLQDLPHAEIRQMPDHSRRLSFPSLPQAGMSSQFNQPDDPSHADHRRSYPSMSFQSIPEDIPASHSETNFDQLLQDNYTRSSYPHNVNVHVYINLIEKERYYWLLDLFNELNIWKTVVPTYCLRELETGTSNNSLLINSLLNCSIYSNIRVEELLEQQKSEWYRARDLDIAQTDLKIFENLLISIALMLLAINLKSNKHTFTTFTKIILNNQIKIFNKIIHKLEPVLSSAKFHTILLINSIQSIMILKQILIKKFELDSIRASTDQDKDPGIIQFSNPFASNTTFTDSYKKKPIDLHDQDKQHEQPQQEQPQQFDVLGAGEDLQEEIVYPDPSEALDTFANPEVRLSNEQENGAILSNFLELNRFEISKLNNSFEDFNIPLAYTSITPRSSLGEDQPDQESELKQELHRELQQELFQQLQSDPKYKTDSMKLRDYAWYLIKISYVIRHPECETISIDYSYIYKEDNLILPTNEELDSPQLKSPPSMDIDEDRAPNEGDPRPVSSTHRIVFPNERGVAINLLREYINKLINYDSAKSIGESNSKIDKIFKLIDESMIEQPVKMCWRDGFNWTLTNISNDEYDFSLGKRKDQIADIN